MDKLVDAGKIDAKTCELAKLEPLPGNPLTLPQFSRIYYSVLLKKTKHSMPLQKYKPL
ncbi:MAG: hypothetical protein WDM90_01730 [Ferruginibacter sp.]